MVRLHLRSAPVAINITDGRGLSNEARGYIVTVEEEQGNAVFAIHFVVKAL